jgi:hypothetical protein
VRHFALILLGAAVGVTASAQDRQSPTGIDIRDFSISDSFCGYKHDSSVEKVLQTIRVEINTAKPPPDSPVATFELRNNSAKTITAYVINHTYTHGGKTDYYGALGTDLVYEMAMMKGSGDQTLPNATFPPGGVVKQEVRGGGRHGQFAVFPCMVLFEDGTFIGPTWLSKDLMHMRADNAKAIGALIADLKLARDSPDPETFLINRAKQIKRISEGKSGEEPYRYLEIVASGLSPSGTTPMNRKTITTHISALQTQQEMLIEQSTLCKAK